MTTQIAEIYARAIHRSGESMRLRRYFGTNYETRTFFDWACEGIITKYMPTELTPTIHEGDRNVYVTFKSLFEVQFPLPIKAGDKVVIREKEHEIISVDVNERSIGGATGAIVLQVRG